jgi:hypothetical protein
VSNGQHKDDLRRGIPAARSSLGVARLAAGKYLAAAEASPPNKLDMMLYYGAFFLFARAALYALEASDGKASSALNAVQAEYFAANIKSDPVFQLLHDERCRIGHGDDSWAFHPLTPMSAVERFLDAGFGLEEAVFSKVWPDGAFKGMSIEQVFDRVWRQVSNWLDAIDAEDDQRQRQR